MDALDELGGAGEQPTERIPDRSTYITAVRSWQVLKPHGHLHSHGWIWTPRQAFEAVCESMGKEEHEAPHPGCSCGVYAIRYANRDNSYWLNSGAGSVYGEVALWGNVEIHTDGYRAQYAYPLNFAASLSNVAQRSAQLYGVPSIPYPEFKELISTKYTRPPACPYCKKPGHAMNECPQITPEVQARHAKLVAQYLKNKEYHTLYVQAKRLGITVNELKERLAKGESV